MSGYGFALSRRLHVEPLEDRRMLAVITVSNLDDSGIGSLRDAITIANNTDGPDEIDFLVTGTIALTTGELVVTDTLSINGPGQDLLTVDAQQMSRIINYSSLTGDLLLAKLTLENGHTSGDNSLLPGGTGFFHSTYSGGGIRFLSEGTLAVMDSDIIENRTTGAQAFGGGIFSHSGIVVLTNSTLSGNRTEGERAAGGGLYARYGEVNLVNSTLKDSVTMGLDADGGGVWTRSATVTLTGSTLSGNRTVGTGSAGGAIHSISAAVTLNNSTLSGNSTKGFVSDGGAIRTSIGAVTLNNSTLSGNFTQGDLADGGGIFSLGAITITNSSVTQNRVEGDGANGGGIFVPNFSVNALLTIKSSIIAGNSVGAGSSGPDLLLDPDSPIDIAFSLIGDNASTFLYEAQTADNAGNLIGSSDGVGIIGPLLIPLADNGGPTLTHALLPGSPALDAGDPSMLFDPAEFDQRGSPFLRVANARIDIGAYELQTVIESADFDGDLDIDGADFLSWQRGFGTSVASKGDGDADNDSIVDAADLAIWQQQFGDGTNPLANSADFDSDNDIDGGDFLAWQRGFGILAPNANKPDGDADNDGDVDANDLVIWSSQFGQPAPVADVADVAAPLASEPVAAENLIDEVMAIALVRDAQVAEAPVFDEEPAFSETFTDHAFTAEAIAQVAIADESEPLDSRSSDITAAEAPWLADELLEQVFG